MLIYELASRAWNIRELKELLEDTLPASGQFHNLEISHTFPGVGEKILVINAKRVIQKIHKEQLTLLAIEDITEHKAN